MAYTIKSGDTLSAIAAANKTTVSDIMKANPSITDPNKIYAGASLNLPTATPSTALNVPGTKVGTTQPSVADLYNKQPAQQQSTIINPGSAAVSPTSRTAYNSAGQAVTFQASSDAEAQAYVTKNNLTWAKGIPTQKPIIPSTTTGVMQTSDEARATQKKIEETQAQIKTIQADLTTAQSLGYGPNDQIIRDPVTGQILPPGTKTSEEGKVVQPTTLTIKDFTDQLKEAGISAPEVPSLMETYTGLAGKYNIEGLQKQVTDIDTQIAEVQDSLTAGIHKISGELAPMELITGRQQELQNQATEKLNALNRTKSNLVTQYNNAIGTVSMLMGFTQQDYANASTDYNTKFNQFISLANMITGQQNTAQDNARANLSIITNAINSSKKTWTELDSTMQAQIRSLEVQAGMPQGTTEYFLSAKPNAEVLSTVQGTDAEGNDIVTFIYKDPETGMPGSMQVVQTGGVTAPKAGTALTFTSEDRGRLIAAGLTNTDITNLLNDINTYGKDGALNESGLNDAQKKVVNNILTGITAEKGGETPKGEEYLNENWIRTNFTVDQLIKAAKDAGFGTWDFLGIRDQGTITDFVNALLEQVKSFRLADYSDEDILATIIKTYFSGK
jgi:murein DD-endopeptidase MepM/ murein hydrolase activator NlpD